MKRACFALAVAVIVLCALLFQRHAPAIIHWINTLGLLAPVFFLLLYCLGTILFFPTMVLTLAGGALFGPVTGTFFNLLGATIGAVCAFCISRYLVFDWLAAKKNPRIDKMISGVERQGWQFVALIRLVPLIPFNLVNYGLGVTRIKLSHFFIATAIFLIPTEIFFTYCGYAGIDMLTNPGGFYKSSAAFIFPALGIALFILHLTIRHHRQKQKPLYESK